MEMIEVVELLNESHRKEVANLLRVVKYQEMVINQLEFALRRGDLMALTTEARLARGLALTSLITMRTEPVPAYLPTPPA